MLSSLSGPRRILVTAAPLGAAVCLRLTVTDSGPLVLWLPVALLGASALLAHRRGLSSQLGARAIWWANLVLGTLIAAIGNGHERPPGAGMAALLALALLTLGRRGLEDEAGPFTPVAFRTTLICSMVMALADGLSLFFWGALLATEHPQLHDGLLFLLSWLLGVSIYGMFRLRTWGVLLALVTNLAVAVLAGTGILDLPQGLTVVVIGTAVLQLLVPIPLIAGLIRGAAPQAPRISRAGSLLSSALVLVLAGFALWNAFLHQGRVMEMFS